MFKSFEILFLNYNKNRKKTNFRLAKLVCVNHFTNFFAIFHSFSLSSINKKKQKTKND